MEGFFAFLKEGIFVVNVDVAGSEPKNGAVRSCILRER